jgi:hypothetical protein
MHRAVTMKAGVCLVRVRNFSILACIVSLDSSDDLQNCVKIKGNP